MIGLFVLFARVMWVVFFFSHYLSGIFDVFINRRMLFVLPSRLSAVNDLFPRFSILLICDAFASIAVSRAFTIYLLTIPEHRIRVEGGVVMERREADIFIW